MDRSDVVASLNELEEQGFVERSPDPSDGRRNVIRATRAGQRRLAALETILTEVNDEFLAPLSQAERRQLTRLLARLADDG